MSFEKHQKGSGIIEIRIFKNSLTKKSLKGNCAELIWNGNRSRQEGFISISSFGVATSFLQN